MKQLNQNWLTEGLLDFEYKKYLLLAYLQEVSRNFNQSRIYPFLSDLILHYNNVVSIKERKVQVIQQFPKKLTQIDMRNLRLQYERVVSDDAAMEVIEEIIDFALPLLKDHVRQGADLHEFVEEKMKLFSVGVVPLHNLEGYLFIRINPKKDTRVFEYTITIFENAYEKFRGIKTHYIATYKSSYTNTYENIKVDLIRSRKELPTPAVYVAEAQMEFPFEETVLPIAKRALVREVCKNVSQ